MREFREGDEEIRGRSAAVALSGRKRLAFRLFFDGANDVLCDGLEGSWLGPIGACLPRAEDERFATRPWSSPLVTSLRLQLGRAMLLGARNPRMAAPSHGRGAGPSRKPAT
jgi:hypothetical protein